MPVLGFPCAAFPADSAYVKETFAACVVIGVSGTVVRPGAPMYLRFAGPHIVDSRRRVRDGRLYQEPARYADEHVRIRQVAQKTFLDADGHGEAADRVACDERPDGVAGR